jgi:hypothetical protein
VGSLVKANGIYLYLSLALKSILKELMLLLCTITTGKQVDGNVVGFTFEINSTKYLIEEIA